MNKTDKDWEARALEVWNDSSVEGHGESMVRFGREMADARAEEIARRVLALRERAGDFRSDSHDSGLTHAAEIALSAIKEPQAASVVQFTSQTEAAIRAEERNKVAEEIARKLEIALFAGAAVIARSFIAKPKTREQVLEEALLKLALRYEAGTDVEEIARRALEWKP